MLALRRSLRARRIRAGAPAVAALALAACSFALDFDELDRDGARARTPGPDARVEGAATATGPYASEVAADGPLAYWRFDELAGTRAIDATGRADGTYLAAPVLGVDGALAGDPSTAWRTDGPRGGMNAGAGFAFRGAAPFTLEVWIRPTLIDGNYRMIFQRKSADAKGRQDYGVFVRDGRIVFQRYVDDNRAGVSAPAPPPGDWHHVAVTYDGSSLGLYVDGVVGDTAPDTRPFAGLEADLLVGTSAPEAEPFLGSLDEAAVYGVALTADQVRRHVESARRSP